jgi:VCBS repeat-containing protein
VLSVRTSGISPTVNLTSTGGSTAYSANSGTATITVTAVNDAPVAVAQAVTTPEDTAKAITLSGTDVEGSALTYSVATQPTKGTLSGTAPNLTYTPNANANGSDSFTFVANDGVQTSVAATVSISITAVNDAPTISSAAFQKIYETVNPSRNQSGAIVYSQGYGTGASDAASQFSATGQSISRIRYRMDLTVGGTARYAEATFDGWSGVKASDLRVAA